MVRKTGIMGGSFDPVHLGHVHVAREARRLLGLERVVLVPAAVQPLKAGRVMAGARHRLALLRTAAREVGPWLEVSALELERGGRSYTVDTLEALHRSAPEEELYFIAGADTLETLERWWRHDDVLRLARFCALTRPGYELSVPRGLAGRVRLLEVAPFPASSSEARGRLGRGEDTAGLLSPAVALYAREHRLYGARAEAEAGGAAQGPAPRGCGGSGGVGGQESEPTGDDTDTP